MRERVLGKRLGETHVVDDPPPDSRRPFHFGKIIKPLALSTCYFALKPAW